MFRRLTLCAGRAVRYASAMSRGDVGAGAALPMAAENSPERSGRSDAAYRRGSAPEARSAMWRQVLAGTMLGLLLAIGAVACDKGPMQRTGEKIDRATGQDKVIGTGPVERAGRNVDEAVKDLKK